jgi:hypothetical protein
MIGGHRLTQLVYVAAKLGIADHLRDGPRTVDELARLTGAHADSLYRVLRTLSGLGVFVETGGKQFRINPAGALLRSGVPDSSRVGAIIMGEDDAWRSWGALFHSVKTGEAAFDHVYGKNVFEWYKEHPAEARLFDDLQAELTRARAGFMASGYDFPSAGTIVDVGGGAGALLSAILRQYPAARGVLFDLDHVIEAAKAALDPAIASRCRFMSGDFFKSVPGGGDVYVLKYIIHDWSDDRSRQILASCRNAMAGKGRLLLVEDLICEANKPCRAKIGDITMMVRTGYRRAQHPRISPSRLSPRSRWYNQRVTGP